MNKLRELEVCPNCGKPEGERLIKTTLPTLFYVKCKECGFRVQANAQTNATQKWNRLSIKSQEDRKRRCLI